MTKTGPGSYEDVSWSNPLEHWERFPGWDLIPKIPGSNNLPSHAMRYKAFELVKPEDVKVVILGQDPYPTRGHANGLAFSVNAHVKRLPKSLENIFNEYRTDLGFAPPRTGDLSSWATNGVLLLNTALTTEEGKRGSHIKQWKPFTERMVRWLSGLPGRRVFILWGSTAQEYGDLIGKSNTMLSSSHPSPLSCKLGFYGSRPFTRACEALGVSKEMWRL